MYIEIILYTTKTIDYNNNNNILTIVWNQDLDI